MSPASGAAGADLAFLRPDIDEPLPLLQRISVLLSRVVILPVMIGVKALGAKALGVKALGTMALGVTALLLPTLASSHPAPFSFVDVDMRADGISGIVVIHDFDAAHELQIATPSLLLDPAVAREHRIELIALLEIRLRLTSEGERLHPTWGEIDVLPERQSVRLPFTLPVPVRSTLDMEASLFPYDAKHQTFVNLYENGALKQQAILDSRKSSLTFYRGTLQGRWAVVTTFVKAGIEHILIGPDHVLFLFGLLLLGGSVRRLALIVTAFTLGHSITLSLAALGLVYLSPNLVEPVIALSIVVVGVDNLLVNRQRSAIRAGRHSPFAAARDLRTWMAALFGLIHGFGFAAVLIELGLPREALGWSLAAFNIGVEFGQLLIVIGLLALGRLATKHPAYRPERAERFLTIASMAVIAAGVYWLIQRLGFIAVA